jgi:hypothetical protein
LDEYTLEELLYEYHDKSERKRAAEKQVDKDSDKIEDDRLQNNLDWAEAEEHRELEALKKQQEEDQKKKDAEWMKKQLEKEKEQLGENFGEDLEIKF